MAVHCSLSTGILVRCCKGNSFFYNDSKVLVKGLSVNGTGCRDPTCSDFSNIHTSRIIIMYYHVLMLAQVTCHV